MKIRNYEVFNLHAELCRAMAHPYRLIIIDMLALRDMSVGEIAQTLEVRPAAVSQHLRVLKDKGLVSSQKAGQTVHYHLATPQMMDACHILRKILLDNMKNMGKIAEDLSPADLIEDTSE